MRRLVFSARIGQKCLHLGGRRNATNQVEAEPPQDLGIVGRAGGHDMVFAELLPNPPIDLLRESPRSRIGRVVAEGQQADC